MTKRLRQFILQLPGVNSYCDCETLCSQIEVEHVMPRKILMQRLDLKEFKIANRDPHNLYKCCHMLNSEKGSLVLDKYLGYEFGGMLARSCLYMDSRYLLNFEPELIKTWNNLSSFYPPFHFEYSRSKIIAEYTGNVNPFIDDYNKLYNRY